MSERTDNVLDPISDPKPHADVAASTLQAAEYLVRQGDAERLRSWLARHSADERAAIIKHLEHKKAPAT
jgi:hypothetical protein